MARIRSIKPSFRTSLTVTAWPRDVRLFFALLWGYCDDHGRGVDEPRLIKADCFPLDDDITPGMVDEWLDLIAASGTIVRYAAGGRRYIAVPEWREHQKPQHPAASVVPPPPPPSPEAAAEGAHEDAPLPSESPPEFLMKNSGGSHEALSKDMEGSSSSRGEERRGGGCGGNASQPAAAPPPARSPRGTRLPDGWKPDRPAVEALKAEYAHLPDRWWHVEHAKFADHFAAAPGQRGVKLDWTATWRKWMRTAAEDAPRGPRPGGRTFHVDHAPPRDVPRPAYDPAAARRAELAAVEALP